MSIGIRIGHGYDAHRFIPRKALVLCGVNVPYQKGLLAHSDGDAPVHALIDAMLGAAGERDIGYHFPDNDKKYENADSLMLLAETVKIIGANGFRLACADITIIAQEPKLSGYITAMRESLASSLGCAVGDVNVKATTEEGMGFTGSLIGIASHAVVLLEKI